MSPQEWTSAMIRIVALTTLMLLSPVVFLLALLLVLFQGKPIFFHQTRLGQRQQEFSLIKFRTMQVNDVDPSTLGTVAFSHPMVTPLGKWLRRLRLDEIPQLLNIIRGEMVFVGPRPCLPGQEEQMTPEQRLRFIVKPGLTGLAEVSGNVLLTHDEQWSLDWRYVRDHSLILDLKICIGTLSVITFGPSRDESYVSETKKMIQASSG